MKSIPIDLSRLAATMQQGDKNIRYLNKNTGAILNVDDMRMAKEGLDPDGVFRFMATLAPVPQIENRTMFRWMREWMDGPARKISDRADGADGRTFLERLIDSVDGPGAFTRFKAAIREPGREAWLSSWDRFRAEKLHQGAVAWLDSIGQSYTEMGVQHDQ